MSVLTRFSLRLGTVVLLAVVLLFAAGVVAATRVPQDLLPDITLPAFILVTPDPGASPDVVDRDVTVPVTNAVQSLSGVDTITSSSSQGASLVVVQLKDGTDARAARQDIMQAVGGIRSSLPQAAQSTTIQSFSTNTLPILQYAVSADESQADLAAQLRSIALPRLKGLAGVSAANVTGAPTQEIDVVLDPARLAAHGLTSAQVVSAIQQAGTTQSIGAVTSGGSVIPVQVSGSIADASQVASIVVGPTSRPSQPATIGELGSVNLASIPADTITRTNGRPSIGLSILKAPDANTVTVANEVKDALPGIKSQIGHGVAVQNVLDQATPITTAIADILREGLLGALFAVLVIFAFLRSARATVVAAISIPLSLLVALIVLWASGLTLNILTLGGMMVAIGRVVDDAIVVLENISRHVGEGRGPLTAAFTGAREIGTAVTSSTLTTVAVFLPIVFLTGIAGSFFRPFALTVVTALAASLVVALTVVPLLASRLIPAHDPARPSRAGNLIRRGYVPVIRWATGHRAITVVLALAILAGSLALIPRLRVNLLDQSSSPNFSIAITMPDNSTIAETDAETLKVEALVRPIAHVSAYQATVGGTSDPFVPAGTVPADPTTASVLVLVDQGTYNQVFGDVQNAMKQYQGPAKIDVGGAQSSANASSSQMQIQVQAPDQATLAQANDRVLAALGGVSGVSNLKSDLAASKPQYDLVPTDRLAASGLSLQALGALVAQQLNGTVAATAQLPAGPVSVRVVPPPGTADSPAALANLPVPTAAGAVPLSSLATLQLVRGPQAIARTNGQRTATVTGTITANDTRAVQASVTGALSQVSLPAGASTSQGGVFQQLNSVLQQFVVAILAAIGLVYLVMVATFRSLLKPLILLVAIPFAAIGAIVALVVTGTALSLPGLIGLLMLTGIVVTNAIVLLDLVEQYRERGLPLQEALVEGGRHRVRPILMTALATMLALVPLALSGPGSGSGFISAPLAVVVIGGLFSSTVLTLVLVPVLYSLVARFTGPRTNLDLEASLAEADGGARMNRPAEPVSPRAAAVAAAAVRLPNVEERLRDVATRLDDDDLEALFHGLRAAVTAAKTRSSR
jgi:hydrophobic/amphiphilic exporter-1 (mainly G- bacteria), HAE1 family